MAGTSKYPTEIDDASTLVEWQDTVTPISADNMNALRDAVINIETVLGTNNPGVGTGTFISFQAAINSFADHVSRAGNATAVFDADNPHRLRDDNVESNVSTGYAGPATETKTIKKHIDAIGNGTVDADNPHGLDIRDIPTTISGTDFYAVTSGQTAYAGINNLKMAVGSSTFGTGASAGVRQITAIGAQSLSTLFPTAILFAKGSVSTAGAVLTEAIVSNTSVTFTGFIPHRLLPATWLSGTAFRYLVVGY
jgi:hypothetical protein